MQAERNHRRKSRSSTKLEMQKEKNKIRKDKTTSRERNEGGKESGRIRYRKGIKARKETKGRQGKTGKDQTITP